MFSFDIVEDALFLKGSSENTIESAIICTNYNYLEKSSLSCTTCPYN